MVNFDNTINFRTSTGRYNLPCRNCNNPINYTVSKVYKEPSGKAYRKVEGATCRKCRIKYIYVVRPHVVTFEEAREISKRIQDRKSDTANKE